VIAAPLRSAADVARLRPLDPERDTPFVLEAIRLVRRACPVPLLGFAGAPFTLASYLVEGRGTRDLVQTKRLLHGDPATWHRLLAHLTDATLAYLEAQVAAGAQAVQVFDSWVGALAPRDYAAAVLPHMQRLFAGLAALGVPVIHFGTGTAGLLPLMAHAGGDVIGVDWRVRLGEAWARIGPRAIQGNLDPAVLLAPFPVAAAAAREILDEVAGRPGHIFNLGHGVLPQTPLGHLARLVELVHESTAAAAPAG
jgi:uroporphyrinogen decarboxylase